jgi:hypothetical protein
VSGLTAVETHPGVVVVVGSDLASVAMWGFMAFWLLYGLNWVLGPCELVAWDWVLYCMGAWNLDMGCPKLLCLWSALAVEPCAP